MKRLLSFVFLFILSTLPLFSHGGFQKHCEEMLDVLGIHRYKNPTIYNTQGRSWAKYISSDMIDNKDFHIELEQKYKHFHISSPNRHRFLFHWGYESEPWTDELEHIVIEYCNRYNYDIPSTIRSFKSDIKSEQSRRNLDIIKMTEKTFQLYGGTDGVYAHFLASIAYNVHILGDYESDNKVFAGLAKLDYLIGQFVIEIRELDQNEGKTIIKEITKINKMAINDQKKADMLMEFLKQSMPDFIKRARKGHFLLRLKDHGVIMKDNKDEY